MNKKQTKQINTNILFQKTKVFQNRTPAKQNVPQLKTDHSTEKLCVALS